MRLGSYIKRQISKIRDNFDAASTTYDCAASVQDVIASRLLALSVNMGRIIPSKITSTILTAPKILEIGCGTGLLTSKVIPLLPKSELFLLDVAPAMLARCKQNIEEQGYEDKHTYEFICSNIETFNFQEKYFDMIISSMTLQWLSDLIPLVLKFVNHSSSCIFALPLKGTLRQWYKLCEDKGIRYQYIDFYSKKNLAQQLKDNLGANTKLTFLRETITLNYKSALDFALILKRTGAHYGSTLIDKIMKEDRGNIIYHRKALAEHQPFKVDYVIGYLFIT